MCIRLSISIYNYNVYIYMYIMYIQIDMGDNQQDGGVWRSPFETMEGPVWHHMIHHLPVLSRLYESTN